MIELTNDPIDPARAVALVSSPRAGAIVLFLGVTREFTAGRQTASLDYQCYPEMARRKMAELESKARQRWTIIECVIIHRLGHLEIEEASVAVAVSSPHRGDAFECGHWIIDKLKEEVPIWKQENWADGTQEWVHPGLDLKQVQQQQQQQSTVGHSDVKSL
jgi:molybdopterin synthase catalytic subunit